MLTASQQDRITALQPYLNRIAHNLVSTYYHDQEPQELVQAMNLHILEQVSQDPTYFDYSDGCITKVAAWAAHNHCNSALKGVNHGWDREAFSLDENSAFDNPLHEFCCEADTPDAGTALDIRAVLSTLSETTQLVASLIAAGFKGDELAEKAGLGTKQAVSYHRRLLREALAPVYAGR